MSLYYSTTGRSENDAAGGAYVSASFSRPADILLQKLVCFWFILKFFIYYLSHNIIESVDFLPAEQRECSLTDVVIRVTCCLTGMMSRVLN